MPDKTSSRQPRKPSARSRNPLHSKALRLCDLQFGLVIQAYRRDDLTAPLARDPWDRVVIVGDIVEYRGFPGLATVPIVVEGTSSWQKRISTWGLAERGIVPNLGGHWHETNFALADGVDPLSGTPYVPNPAHPQALRLEDLEPGMGVQLWNGQEKVPRGSGLVVSGPETLKNPTSRLIMVHQPGSQPPVVDWDLVKCGIIPGPDGSWVEGRYVLEA